MKPEIIERIRHYTSYGFVLMLVLVAFIVSFYSALAFISAIYIFWIEKYFLNYKKVDVIDSLLKEVKKVWMK